MSINVVPIPVAPNIYVARQVRLVDPANDGVIHFVDGNSLIFNYTGQQGGVPSLTFVNATNAAGQTANIVPNPGDWLLTLRPTFNTQSPDQNPGTQSASLQFQNPQPAGTGPWIYLTNLQYIAAYNTSYALATPNQGIVP